MADTGMRGNDSGPEIGPHAADVEARTAELVGDRATQAERLARRHPGSGVVSAADRESMIKDARAIDFPVALRGYDRTAVDRYVEKVNRLLAELEISSSPESAVRHALEEVTEETRDILQHAHQTAEEITARSRAKADDRLQQAEHEAQEVRAEAQHDAAETREAAQAEAHQLREEAAREVQRLRETAQREVAELREATAHETQQLRDAVKRETDDARGSARRECEEMLESAETRARELARSAELIWRERRRLIDDMRNVGEQLVAIGETEGKRFPQPPDAAPHAAEPRRPAGSNAIEPATTSPV